MKTILSLLLFSVLTVSAQMPFITGMMAQSAPASTETIILLEGWEGSGAENTWSTYNANAGVVFDQDADTSALTTGKPTSADNEALSVTIASADGAESSLYWDNGTAIDIDTQPLNIEFYIYVTTKPDTTENIAIFTCGNSATPGTTPCATIRMLNNAGTVQVRGEEGSNSGYANLTDNSWNKIVLHIDTTTTGTASTITVNGGTANTFNRAANDARYFHFGAPRVVDIGDSGVFYLDLIKISKP